jgi:hypothetical protein
MVAPSLSPRAGIRCNACGTSLASLTAPCRCKNVHGERDRFAPAAPVAPASKPKRPRAGLAAETAMRDALVAAGYVEDDDFVREYAFALDEGRAYRFDFRFLGTDVAVEIEGGAHAVKRQHRDDCEKASLAAALGYRVVRVHRQMIEDGSAVQFVRRAIEFKRAAANAAKGA